MPLELTRNWSSIQIKSIDPYADVASDVTSRLTKIMGADNVYVNGFDLIKYECDVDNNCIAVTLGPGIGIVSNIVIEITNTTVVKLTNFPIPTINNYVLVLEYIYSKTTPAPIAILRGVKIDEMDSRIHLPLYNFKLNGWNTFVNTDTLIAWINSSSENFKDERHKTGYLPRSGGTVHGRLYNPILIPDDPFEVINKQFLDKALGEALGSISGLGILQNIVTKSGAEMTGPLTMKGDPYPTSENQLITKNYVDTYAILKKGDSMIGPLILKGDPKKPLEAATKDYVDKGVQHAIANMHISMRHGDLSQLNEDHHTQYILVNGDRGFTAPIEGQEPLTSKHLATRRYIDNIAETINTRIDGIVAGGGGGGILEHKNLNGLGADDHKQYILVNGTRAFTGVISGIDPIEKHHLATKRYVDDKLGSGGSGATAHSDLTGLLNDDHPQYALLNGSRPFMNAITVPAPTTPQHAVNLDYMMTYVTEQINNSGGGGGPGTLPPNIKYILSDGSNSFTAPISGVSGIDNNNLTTLGQIRQLFQDEFSDHDLLKNRDQDDAHSQYVLLKGGSMTGPLNVQDPTEGTHAVPYRIVKAVEDSIADGVEVINNNKENIEKLAVIIPKVEGYDDVINSIDNKIATSIADIVSTQITPALDNAAKIDTSNIFSQMNVFNEGINLSKLMNLNFSILKKEDFDDLMVSNYNNSIGQLKYIDVNTPTDTTEAGANLYPINESNNNNNSFFPYDIDYYGLGYITQECIAERDLMNFSHGSNDNRNYNYMWSMKPIGPSLQLRRSPIGRSNNDGSPYTTLTNSSGFDTIITINGGGKNLSSTISPISIIHNSKSPFDNKRAILNGHVMTMYSDALPSGVNIPCDKTSRVNTLIKYGPIGSIYYTYSDDNTTITHMYVKIKALTSDTVTNFDNTTFFKKIF